MGKNRQNEMKAGSGRKGGEGGYTLLELLIVLAILALIATFAVPNLMKLFGSAKSDVAAIQINNLGAALDIYRLENGAYPEQGDGLEALVRQPAGNTNTDWGGPYIDKEAALIDPWGQPYRYRISGESGAYEIYSLGADNAEGGEGEDRDIRN